MDCNGCDDRAGSFVLVVNPVVCMNLIDWIILFGTLLTIVLYGTWKTRGAKILRAISKETTRINGG